MYIKIALAGAIASLSFGSSLVFADQVNARQMALGGTGSVAGDYSGVRSNPSLLSAFHESDDFGTNLSLGIEASDPDDLVKSIENAQDTIDEVEQKIDSGTAQPGVDDEALIQSIRDIGGKTVQIKAGLSGQIAVPSDFIGVAIVGGTHLRVASDFTYDPSDEDRIKHNLILNQPMDDLESYIGVTGVGVTEVGVALSHSYADFDFGVAGIPLGKLAVGVTPKYQRIDLIDYEQSVADFNSSDFNEDNYRTESSGFNADIGFIQYAGDEGQYRFGASVENLVSKEVVSPLGNAYEMKPVPVIGGGYDNGWLSTTVEVDLNERAGFGRISDVQYAKVGVELDAFRNAQLRIGYRDAINGGDEDVVTAGVGISPFDVIHLDIGGLYGSKNTYGVSVQLGVKI